MSSTTIETPNYPIFITPSAGEELDRYLQQKNYTSVFVLMDENIMEHCWPALQNDSEILKEAEVLVIDAGEEQKDLEVALQLWETLTEYEADRKSLLVNIGGGVISDLGGFVAATYKRGIDYINIPTSLLAIIDASIGGKTAINLKNLKNQVGLFVEPNAIFIQTSFLQTLPPRQWLSGWAEMLKHAIVYDKGFWNEIKNIKDLNLENLEPHLRRAIEIKKEIVEIDFKEENLRKALNFGHTLGHAIESYSLENDRDFLLHGEAVAMGMLYASALSVKKGLLSQEDNLEIYEVLMRFFKPYKLSDDFISRLESLLNQDKKKDATGFNFTFVSAIGQTEIDQYCTLEFIIESIRLFK
jgi:3-dehydroquinate synthase